MQSSFELCFHLDALLHMFELITPWLCVVPCGWLSVQVPIGYIRSYICNIGCIILWLMPHVMESCVCGQSRESEFSSGCY